MNRRLLIQITTPAVVLGAVLLIGCLVGAWYVSRLQAGLGSIISHNVSSLRAAQRLEMSAQKLRLHSLMYLLDPNPELKNIIDLDQQEFETWLQKASRTAVTPEEQAAVANIGDGYNRFRESLGGLKALAERDGGRSDLRAFAATGPVRWVVEPCEEYAQLNEDQMNRTAEQSNRLTEQLQLVMLMLGVAAPLGGLVSGYGIARGLSRSLYKLSVHVQDMAQHLDWEVGAVRLLPEGDFQLLDWQLQKVVDRVAEVTEQLQQQQQEILRAQQLAAVGQLAAGVAHEVRNPLTAIKMLVEAALRPVQPRPFTLDNLRVIDREVRRLEQTVQGFLDFARPPALQPVPIDLRKLFRQSAELVAARARQQQVKVEITVPSEPVIGLVDQGRLSTVIVNLFLNALDAMPGGGTLSARLAPRQGSTIRFTVADTGPGIPADVLPRLFTPFVSSKPTGSGLGLSICKRVVEDHGGRIAAENLPTGGARFTVTLPAPPLPISSPATATKEDADARLAGRR
jgi:two-component system sensor histidine kinase HydH